jgi:hypothetical protein
MRNELTIDSKSCGQENLWKVKNKTRNGVGIEMKLKKNLKHEVVRVYWINVAQERVEQRSVLIAVDNLQVNIHLCSVKKVKFSPYRPRRPRG